MQVGYGKTLVEHLPQQWAASRRRVGAGSDLGITSSPHHTFLSFVSNASLTSIELQGSTRASCNISALSANNTVMDYFTLTLLENK